MAAMILDASAITTAISMARGPDAFHLANPIGLVFRTRQKDGCGTHGRTFLCGRYSQICV